MDEATEPVRPSQMCCIGTQDGRHRWRRRKWRCLTERPVRSMGVVVLDELVEHDLELALVEDQHPVEALPADGADETLGDGASPRSSDRRADNPYPVRAEHLVEAGRELPISVPHE